MKTEKSIDGIYEIHFDSPMDMLDAKASTPDNERGWQSEVVTMIGNRNWTDCSSLAEFQRRVRLGWPELIAGIERNERGLIFNAGVAAGMISQTKRRQVRRDNGDVLDFDEFKRGNVDTCWQTTERFQTEARRQRSAVIEINLTASCRVESSAMMWRTTLANLIAKRLSAAGWSVEIVVANMSRNTFHGTADSITAITTVAKPSTVPLSLERLALVTSPAWLRVAVFQAMYANDKKLKPTYGLGNPLSQQSPYVRRLKERGYLALHINSNTLTREAAQANLNALTKQIEAHA